ncbi:CBS domain-containing protein CBSCBSPB5-like [Andrographis paniculata]|uniref:CBS domain-containing protein CBSCBSPB5-like n=1 Tax=Andrographis paniculata TaxID=175694 RepID=UPI0021E8925B|nr:CBS domain-containing protein CBSCBSPB5-like [Andrographis paniculata]XP_051152414.1 CBS domain-containing protein CBSCBSPB5-like [Andrographis paniculata]XP_051152420.1 CBS domain-containing protein CBSCBSPB5-like [Andrographis paniculata]XP_051152424.1 CBS domain-containing protein CBSCBSPB5-like [Andrographis paniculata]
MPGSQGGSSSRRCSLLGSSLSQGRKKGAASINGAAGGAVGDSPRSRKSLTASRSMGLKGDRTVKRLRLLRALTLPDSTNIKEVCRRMAAHKVDAVLLTDSNALLCGILTDKDIATRVIACEVNPEETPVSKVMTRNPVFVLPDALAVEALQKMVHGKFRHLPVVQNGEVVALLDIIKCLYDVIARMERAAEKGKAIVAALVGVEKQWGSSGSGPNTFIETLRDQIFGPSLSTIIPENSKMVELDPSETVLTAAKKICELEASCAIVTTENKPRGILTSKDMLMRVIAQNLPPDSTPVEKVMTSNPVCARIDSPILDALHIMHSGKFLHLPIVDRDGLLVTVVDVLQITNAAVSKVGITTTGISNETASTMMQNFWDSAMALSPDDGDDTMSDIRSDGGETVALSQYSSTSFIFKIQDRNGRMHRFICETQSLTDLVAAILQRIGTDMDYRNVPQIMYEDEDKDRVILASDSDLQAAVHHARLIGLKGLRLYIEFPGSGRHQNHRKAAGGGSSSGDSSSRLRYASSSSSPSPTSSSSSSTSVYSAVAAGAALLAGLSVYAFMKRAAAG